MSQEFKPVARGDLNAALQEVLVDRLTALLKTRGPGHCMKLSDLDDDVMLAVAERLRHAVDGDAQVYVLTGDSKSDDSLRISGSKLVEFRNPLPNGKLRPPLMVFVPNELKTAWEDSFAEATFEQLSVADAYQRLREHLVEALPEQLRHTVIDVLRLLEERDWRWADSVGVVLFLLSIRANGYEPDVVGASLCEVGLVPDFRLLEDPPTMPGRVVRNYECVKTITFSTKSERGRILELGLKDKDLRQQLGVFLGEVGVEDPRAWTKRIVADKANWSLSFDKWIFEDGGGFEQQLLVEVFDVDLPIVQEDEEDSKLAPLIQQKVLLIGRSGPKSFKVRFRSDPAPTRLPGLDHFRLQVIRRESGPTGFTKRKKAWTTNRQEVSVSFTSLSKVEWEEGWHFVRVIACTDIGDPIPLVDAEGQPLPLAGTEDENRQLNESDLFYVVIGDEVELDGPQRAVPKHPSLDHALINLQFSALSAGDDPQNVRCTQIGWSDADVGMLGGRADLLELKFAKEGSVHVPVAHVLKILEQRILQSHRDSISWRLTLSPGRAGDGDITDDVRGWPNDPEIASFIEARLRLFAKIRGENGQMISQGADHSSVREEAVEYATQYIEMVSRALRRAEIAASDEQPQVIADLQKLLAVDSVHVDLISHRGEHRSVILVGPTHPLRVLWLSTWSTLGNWWVERAAEVQKQFIGPTRDALLERLSLINFPAVLSVGGGRILTAIDNVHPFWTVYATPSEEDPRGLIGEICTALGIPEPNIGSFSLNGKYLADRIRRYLVQHPYIQVLSLNCFNTGRAKILADMLLELQKNADFADLRYNIRLFVPDPDAPGVGEDLNELISPTSSLTAAEADVFATVTGSHLFPKLTFAVRSNADFRAAPGEYPAHISMLFDVFPATEIGASPARIEDETAAVHGLLQDFTVSYSEEADIVSWQKRPRHGYAQVIPNSEELPRLLSSLAETLSRACATVATNQTGLALRPVSKLVLDAEGKALLHQVHEISDWVFTIDRSLGIEFFDHDWTSPRPEYLIDHSPDLTANSGRRVVITSRSVTEIRALFERVLADHGLGVYADRAAAILGELRMLSGRLALKLISSPTHRAEALGLALAKMFLEYQQALEGQIVIPLDAHLDLYRPLQKNADEFGDEITLKRTDLALFDLDPSNMTVNCRLVEVKCYQAAGSLSALSQLKTTIAEQIQQSQRALQHHFDPHLSGAQDRPDRIIKTQEFIAMLEFYIDRATRLGYLSSNACSEAKYFLRTMERGYRLQFTRSAIVFDFEKSGLEESGEEDGIEFHRIGLDRIRALLQVLPRSPEETRARPEAAKPTQDTTTRVAILRGLETDLPKLEHAAFLPQRRARSVSWEKLQSPTDETEDDGGGDLRKPVVPLTPPKGSQSVIKSPKQRPEGITAPLGSGSENASSSSSAGARAETAKQPPVKSDQVVGKSEDREAFPHATLGVTGESPQFGILGTISGRKVALDLNQTHTISLFGVQGGGKSYTLGSIVEMATMAIPGINKLPHPLATVVFHYSSTQDYKPEFTTMNHPNSDNEAVQTLAKVFEASPQSLSDIVLLAPSDKLAQRQQEYPDIQVIPLTFASSELQASHWRFLMGAVGNQATYIRVINQVMRGMRTALTLSGLRTAMAASTLPDRLKELADLRLNLAQTYIDESAKLKDIIRPGRLIIVDLRDEFIEKDEALGLFVVLLQLFADATCGGEKFNKLVVFDEAHKYIESPDLVTGLVGVVREMRHKGTSILVASQDPPSVPISLIELSSQIILHRFNSPAWLKHLQKANAALLSLTPEQMARLNAGEAYVWSSKASDPVFSREAVKLQCRPRVTQHGGATRTALPN